jgi:hypothetical protein
VYVCVCVCVYVRACVHVLFCYVVLLKYITHVAFNKFQLILFVYYSIAVFVLFVEKGSVVSVIFE